MTRKLTLCKIQHSAPFLDLTAAIFLAGSSNAPGLLALNETATNQFQGVEAT